MNAEELETLRNLVYGLADGAAANLGSLIITKDGLLDLVYHYAPGTCHCWCHTTRTEPTDRLRPGFCDSCGCEKTGPYDDWGSSNCDVCGHPIRFGACLCGVRGPSQRKSVDESSTDAWESIAHAFATAVNDALECDHGCRFCVEGEKALRAIIEGPYYEAVEGEAVDDKTDEPQTGFTCDCKGPVHAKWCPMAGAVMNFVTELPAVDATADGPFKGPLFIADTMGSGGEHGGLHKEASEALWWMQRAHEPDDESQSKEQYRLLIIDRLSEALVADSASATRGPYFGRALAEVIETASDDRNSDEFVGNVFRSHLHELREQS